VTAKEFRYAIALDRAGQVTADGQAPIDLDPAWTPEHLVLAGLVRCTLQSLRFHTARAGMDFVASATACGRVTRPAADERYSFVELDVDLDVELEPEPAGHALRELLALAERDCFIGASLRPHPRYRWRVNGTSIELVAQSHKLGVQERSSGAIVRPCPPSCSQ
jgi:organic hydroperoxide reductase OsmC/OhrA